MPLQYQTIVGSWPRRLPDGAFVDPVGKELSAWLALGNVLLPPAVDEAASAAVSAATATDITAAKAYVKLTALAAMTPAQMQTWVAANVTNLVQAQDAIATLAIAVGILARRL